MPKKTTPASSKRKRDNTTDLDTSLDKEEEEKPTMAPTQDTSSEKKNEGNDLAGRDFYEVLGVKKDATQKEISMAYRKLATKIHPDKNREDPFANDKFQTLGKIHMTLSDPEKRKIYDATGDASDDGPSTEADWTAYFNLIFKKLTKKDITDFSKKYRGSDEEKKDVLDAYTRFKGNLTQVLDVVMVSREEDLGRFATYCQQAIDAGDVKMYPGFKKFQKHVGKNLEIVEEEEEPEIPQALVQAFANRQQKFDDLTSRLEAKYGGKGSKTGGEGGAKKKKAVGTRAKKGVAAKKTSQRKKAKVVEEEEEDDDVVSDEGEEMEA